METGELLLERLKLLRARKLEERDRRGYQAVISEQAEIELGRLGPRPAGRSLPLASRAFVSTFIAPERPLPPPPCYSSFIKESIVERQRLAPSATPWQ